ncbi:MAG: tRNA pseudouridine(38-40) synthase TruA [Saprospirales bacterium]|nr:MAG: tRNA pseudouridine(38-40) synthase TruA [Saprospirales bacterium]
MRYFGKVAYNGTQYVGWQQQPNGRSVQGLIEDALSKVIRQPTAVVGCGRTDAGVHASCYFFHFDCDFPLEKGKALRQFNGILPEDILFLDLFEVDDEAHARFDATGRTYRYYLTAHQDPFRSETAFFYREMHKLDVTILREVSRLILNSESFFPFTKSDTDLKHYRCNLMQAGWHKISSKVLYFEVKANRFLRGMVRLMTGACLNAATGRITVKEIDFALRNQQRLEKAWSVPAHGLYLTDIEYPYLKSIEKSDIFEPFGPISQ